MDRKIGLLVGREWSFPPAFINEVNRREAGVVAEYVSLDIARMGEPGEYDVIIDRISHEVGFYRAYLKHASLLGTKVVNNPFMWSADDKFFDASLAAVLGVASPKTVVLPNKDSSPASRTRRAFATSSFRWIGRQQSSMWDYPACSRMRTAADGATSTSAIRYRK